MAASIGTGECGRTPGCALAPHLASLPCDTSVEIPGVIVEVDFDTAGEPLVIVMTRPSATGKAVISVTATGMDDTQLCVVLRTIVTTLEHRLSSPGAIDPDRPGGN